ncbi:MAG: hypothetical protein ACRBF0_17400, partial [Calditrichia bacterium]
MSDRDIIRQIEETLGLRLTRVEKIEQMKSLRSYMVDDSNQVIAISLYSYLDNQHYKIISYLQDLANLQTLYLSDNQISDFSFLKELK